MSKNIKNRVFALVLGIIICLNVVILTPRKTEAVVGEAIAGVAVGAAGVGVGPAVVIGVLTVIAGAFIVSVFDGPVPDGEDTNTIAADFANWVAENKPTEFNIFKEKIAFNVASAGLDVMEFLADVDTIKMFSSLFTEFLVERGSLTSAGVSFSYAPTSDFPTGDLNRAGLVNAFSQQFQSYYGVAPEQKVISKFNDFIDWQLRDGHPYFTFLGNINTGPSFDFRYFAVMANQNQFFEIAQRSNGNFDSVPQNSIRCFSNDFNIGFSDYPYYGFSRDLALIFGEFYYSPDGASAYDDAGSIIDLGLAESLQRQIDNIGDNVEDIAAVIDQFIADQVLEDADSRVTHYPDGTTSVDDGVVTTFPGAVDEDGNVDTPDNVDTKPWDDVFSRPVPDVYVPEGSASDLPAGTTTSWYSKLLDWLNSFWKAFLALLKYVFVPDLSMYNNLQNSFNSKFGFVSQIVELWGQFTDSDFGNQRPDFKITIPASFLHSSNDVDCLIIDFSLFDQYRTILHHIIILLAYMAFFKRLLNDLPSLLGYVGGRSHTVVVNNRNTYNY